MRLYRTFWPLSSLRGKTNFSHLSSKATWSTVSRRVWGVLCTIIQYSVQCTHPAFLHDFECSNIFSKCSGCWGPILILKPSIDLVFHKLSNKVFQIVLLQKRVKLFTWPVLRTKFWFLLFGYVHIIFKSIKKNLSKRKKFLHNFLGIPKCLNFFQ